MSTFIVYIYIYMYMYIYIYHYQSFFFFCVLVLQILGEYKLVPKEIGQTQQNTPSTEIWVPFNSSFLSLRLCSVVLMEVKFKKLTM